MIFIYDLDHTVIDSSHRQLTREDGSLDLDAWRENCTRDKIMADKLLPIAHQWRLHYKRGATIIVCTARVMSQDDLDFLAIHELPYHAMLSRPEGNDSPDAWLKVALLANYAKTQGVSWARFCRNAAMFDDNKGVLKSLSKRGLRCYNAVTFNETLAKRA